MDLPTITTTSATTHHQHHHRHHTNTNTNQPLLDPTLVPTGPLTSITDIGFVEDQNARFRKTMEDGHAMIDGFRGVSHDGFFAIYDGHGGKAAVTHVQKMFHKIFEDEMNVLDEHSTHQSTIIGDVNERIRLTHAAFMSTYRRMDEELKEALYNGTTAITCYLTRDFTTTATTNNNDHNNNNNNNNNNNESNENDDKITNNNFDQLLFTSNCGDARVVLSQNGQAHRLTFDHKASEASEVQRIRDSHGFVAFNRVNGILAVTRALGDYAMKQWVISEPYQSCFRIPAKTNRNTSNNNDDFLILACDGLWDVFEDQECVDFVSHLFQQHRMSAQDAAQKLLHKSLEKGSTDNISIMVIKL